VSRRLEGSKGASGIRFPRSIRRDTHEPEHLVAGICFSARLSLAYLYQVHKKASIFVLILFVSVLLLIVIQRSPWHLSV